MMCVQNVDTSLNLVIDIYMLLKLDIQFYVNHVTVIFHDPNGIVLNFKSFERIPLYTSKLITNYVN